MANNIASGNNSQVSINNNNDNSKVTDNWLQNKFAELSQ
jgi:hypothetical protein